MSLRFELGVFIYVVVIEGVGSLIGGSDMCLV